MNHESDIELLLRRAPSPRPPAELKNELIRQARTSIPRPAPRPAPAFSRSGPGWFRRWWLALAPAAGALACAAMLIAQQKEIRELRQELQNTAREPIHSTAPLSPAKSPAAEPEPRELTQLREQAAALRSELGKLEQLRSDNLALRQKLAAPSNALTPAETAALEEAQYKAERVKCANNMKQLGLAARIWAGDNNDMYPPDIVCMSNELNTPVILVCPADPAHQAARDFTSFTPGANCSYETFLAPPGSDTEPTRVFSRCPIHGNVGLYDGSVQMGAAKTHPEWFVQRDGKLYFEPSSGQ